MEDRPRVFGDGVLTVSIGFRGATLYVGATELQYVKGFKVTSDLETGKSEIELIFPASHDPKVSAEIELNTRVAQSLPGVKVKR